MKGFKILLSSFGLLTLVLFYSGCKKDLKNLFNYNVNRNVGVSANDFLSDAKFTELVIEIVHVENFAPTAAAQNNLKQFLEQRLHKPDGISIVTKSIPSPGAATYSVQKLRDIESQHRNIFPSEGKMAAYFFFADNGYVEDTQNSKILGVAYNNTSMAVFQKTVRDHSGGLGQPERAKLETTIMLHEFGHILGLVDAGTTMQHYHKAHGHHCDNNSCLMYYTVETTDFLTNLLGGNPVPSLDQNCLNDLKANGGK